MKKVKFLTAQKTSILNLTKEKDDIFDQLKLSSNETNLFQQQNQKLNDENKSQKQNLKQTIQQNQQICLVTI